MSLIKCKECNNEISDKAKTCPKCGAKNKRPSGCLKLFAILFFMGIFGQILIGVLQTINPNHVKKEINKNIKFNPKSEKIIKQNDPYNPKIGEVYDITKKSFCALTYEKLLKGIYYMETKDYDTFNKFKFEGNLFNLMDEKIEITEVKNIEKKFKAKGYGQELEFWCDFSSLQ